MSSHTCNDGSQVDALPLAGGPCRADKLYKIWSKFCMQRIKEMTQWHSQWHLPHGIFQANWPVQLTLADNLLLEIDVTKWSPAIQNSLRVTTWVYRWEGGRIYSPSSQEHSKTGVANQNQDREWRARNLQRWVRWLRAEWVVITYSVVTVHGTGMFLGTNGFSEHNFKLFTPFFLS